MSIVMLILKIMGILFLLILAMAALVLFYPLSYQARGECGDELSAQGAVWWLFRALRLEFSLQSGEVAAQVYIFGFLKKEKQPEEAEEEQDIEPETFGEAAPEESVADVPKEDEPEPEDLKAADFKQEAKKKQKKKRRKKPEASVKTGRVKRAWQEVTDTGNKQGAMRLWQELLYLLSHVKPKDIRADISFCAKDPALTGQITGILSLLPFLYRYDARICPDFVSDEYYVRGNFKLRGRVAAFHFVRSFIRLIRDKNAMRLYHKIMQA